MPDKRFDSVPLLGVAKIVEELIDRLKPELIYTHHGGDLNIDHKVKHRAVLTATRPAKDQPVREIYAFEVPSSTDWTFGQLQPAFKPNIFMDIANTSEIKVQAMAMYESEVRPFPHPTSPVALLASAQRWGSIAGVEATEAFELIRAIR